MELKKTKRKVKVVGVGVRLIHVDLKSGQEYVKINKQLFKFPQQIEY